MTTNPLPIFESLMQLPVSAILLYAIAAAAFLIYAPFMVVGFARAKVGYDTSAPRAMFDKLPPYAQRATWAHQNSFETFMVFAAAALMAYVTGQNSITAAVAAIAFVVARLFFSIFYILNVPMLRSLMFGIGTLSTGTLFVLSLLSVTAVGTR
ncbi:MAG TPA: MAPEG family protein [Halomicronema sp.]